MISAPRPPASAPPTVYGRIVKQVVPVSSCLAAEAKKHTWKALEYGHHTRLIELAGEINTTRA